MIEALFYIYLGGFAATSLFASIIELDQGLPSWDVPLLTGMAWPVMIYVLIVSVKENLRNG